MKVILKRVRLAFADSMWEPKSINNGEARCSVNGIMDPKTPEGAAAIDALRKTIQQVAIDKWGAKAADIVKALNAKGDLCLHDGAAKAEYDGFAGNMFVSAANKGRPAIVAKRRYNGKAVGLDQGGNTYIEGVRTDVGFECKVPYSGCYANLSIDVWAQDNAYGKRVNAKLLAIQFEDDGAAFSGGEGYSDADFDDTSDNSASDGFFGGSAAPAAAGGDDFFGGSAAPAPTPWDAPAPAPANDFFAAPAPAPSSTSFF